VLLVIFALPLWFERTAARPPEDCAIVIRGVGEQLAWHSKSSGTVD
jgi:hypothetical protein